MYKSLQSTRALAALLVLFFHLGKAIADEKYFALDGFAAPYLFGGVAGVDFFLVLSGFIIYFVHKKDFSRPAGLASYLYKRAIRIYPSYWIVLLSVYLVARLSPSLSAAVPHDWWVIVKALTLMPIYNEFAGQAQTPVLVVAWSLQYEMFFYLIFALAIFNLKLGAMAGLTVLLVNIALPGGKDAVFPESFYGKDYILLFFMGMFAAYLHKHCVLSKQQAALVFMTGLVMLVIAIIDFNNHTYLFSSHIHLAFGLASMTIIFALVALEDRGTIILGGKFFQLLGGASYAIYLIHYPAISAILKILIALNLNSLGLFGGITAFMITLVVVVAVSVLFHLYIEKPIAKRLKLNNKVTPAQ